MNTVNKVIFGIMSITAVILIAVATDQIRITGDVVVETEEYKVYQHVEEFIKIDSEASVIQVTVITTTIIGDHRIRIGTNLHGSDPPIRQIDELCSNDIEKVINMYNNRTR